MIDCPHTDKPYYAKGMCVNCYHRQGRTKKAWNCPHTTKTHYSKGLCKYCYLANYYKNRTVKRGRKPESTSSENNDGQEVRIASAEEHEDYHMHLDLQDEQPELLKEAAMAKEHECQGGKIHENHDACQTKN